MAEKLQDSLQSHLLRTLPMTKRMSCRRSSLQMSFGTQKSSRMARKLPRTSVIERKYETEALSFWKKVLEMSFFENKPDGALAPPNA